MHYDVRKPPARDSNLSIPGELTMAKSKRRKVSCETFNAMRVDSFASIADDTGSPVCLICVDNLANKNGVDLWPTSSVNPLTAFEQLSLY